MDDDSGVKANEKVSKRKRYIECRPGDPSHCFEVIGAVKAINTVKPLLLVLSPYPSLLPRFQIKSGPKRSYAGPIFAMLKPARMIISMETQRRNLKTLLTPAADDPELYLTATLSVVVPLAQYTVEPRIHENQ